MKVTYLGIDPGIGGALCVIWGDDTIDAYKCPKTTDRMAAMIKHIVTHCEIEDYGLVVGIEKVWARPTNATRAAFTFGMNYGAWLGILSCSYIDPIIMLPREWQSMLKRYKIPKDYMERKRKFKVIAQKYVEFNVTLATADAILIANYLKQKGR